MSILVVKMGLYFLGELKKKTKRSQIKKDMRFDMKLC